MLFSAELRSGSTGVCPRRSDFAAPDPSAMAQPCGWRLEALFADPRIEGSGSVRTLSIGLCGGPLKRLQFYWTPAQFIICGALHFGSCLDSDTATAGAELGVTAIRNLQRHHRGSEAAAVVQTLPDAPVTDTALLLSLGRWNPMAGTAYSSPSSSVVRPNRLTSASPGNIDPSIDFDLTIPMALAKDSSQWFGSRSGSMNIPGSADHGRVQC
jgi:hypothetical protein